MARISEETIRRVAEATDIVALISSYFPLKRAGSNYRALCPFHNEKTPSFMVTPARQSFRCFGCGAGGGVFRFVMDYEHLPFAEAVRRLAARAGVAIVEESGGTAADDRAHYRRRRLLALHAEASAWFHQNLLESPEAAAARAYVARRGLGSETIATWKIGYAPNSWDALLGMLQEKKFTREEMAQSGLTSSREGEEQAGRGRLYARFRGRLMFPINNDYGEVIAFSGRLLDEDAKAAKYVNSPETALFTKGRVLFALDKSKRALIEAGEAIVCEGQIDAIRVFEAGVKNVIAPQGTAFTPEQARLLSRFVSSVILCFDSDKAGQEASSRSLPALLENGLSVRIARLPEGSDPDSMIQERGVGEFRTLVAQAPDFFDYAVGRARAAGVLESPSRTAAVTKKLGGWIALIKDPVARDAVIGRASAQLGVSLESIRAQMRQAGPTGSSTSRLSQENAPAEEPPLLLSEAMKTLCRHALMDADSRAWLAENGAECASQLEEGGILLEKIVGFPGALESPAEVAAFAATLDSRLERAWAALDTTKTREDLLSATVEYWRGLELLPLKALLESAKARLRDPALSPNDRLHLQQEVVDLNHRLRQASSHPPA